MIVAVLLFDIGLAIAGGVLLVKGLAKDDANSSKASDASSQPAEKRTEAPSMPAHNAPAVVEPARAAKPTAAEPETVAEAATAAKLAAGSSAIAAHPRPATSLATSAAAPAARKDTTKQRDDKRDDEKLAAAPTSEAASPAIRSTTTAPSAGASTTNAQSGRSAGASTTSAAPAAPSSTRDEAKPAASEPQDPYPAVDTNREIDAAAARSQSAIDRCQRDHAPAAGKIVVAFQVRPDGRVANVAAVESSTGNSELARCIVTEVSSWRVSAHGGAAIDMSRAFNVR